MRLPTKHFNLTIFLMVIMAGVSFADSRFCLITKNQKTLCRFESVESCRRNVQDPGVYCVPNSKFDFIVSGGSKFCTVEKNYAICAYNAFKECNTEALRRDAICTSRGVVTKKKRVDYLLYDNYLK